MKIIHIIPGAGGRFYCGNCVRDIKYLDTLRKLGHEVTGIPLYLPLFTDGHDPDRIPVFYGAASIHLKQRLPVLKKAPGWFDRLLNSKGLLKLAASQAKFLRVEGLEELTISVLMGEHGGQHKELEKMTDWMLEYCKPDVVHLSNALLSGLAPRIKEKLKVPVICSLQDECKWVIAMSPACRNRIWKLISENARYVDRFVAVSKYYGEVSIRMMGLPAEKVANIHIGVDPADYRFVNSAGKSRNIGFLSRMCHDNGLDILADAFVELKKDLTYEDVKLIITGGSTRDDKKFINTVRNRFSSLYLANSVEFQDDFEGRGRQLFFRKVSILSVPVRHGEAFGMYLAEAMASGIPVVQPALGAFPEIIEKTKGGLLYGENKPELLARTLKALLDDREMLQSLSVSARKGMEEGLNIRTQAAELIRLYKETTEAQQATHP